jgi:hypothetical protein
VPQEVFHPTSIWVSYPHHNTMSVRRDGRDDISDDFLHSQLRQTWSSQDCLEDASTSFLSASDDPSYETGDSAYNQSTFDFSLARCDEWRSFASNSDSFESIYKDATWKLAQADKQAFVAPSCTSKTSCSTGHTYDMWWSLNDLPKDTGDSVWRAQNIYKGPIEPNQTHEPPNVLPCSISSSTCFYPSSEDCVTDSFPKSFISEDSHIDLTDGVSWGIFDQGNYLWSGSGMSEQQVGEPMPVSYQQREWLDGGVNDWNSSYCSSISGGGALGEQDRSAFALGQATPPVPREHKTRFACSHPGCSVSFKHSADLTRHSKTIHKKAESNYKCAFEGCPKAYKVWTRLDSFKKHARHHGIEKLDGLVRNSRRDSRDLPVSLVTPSMMSQKGVPESHSRLLAGRERQSSNP